MGMLNFPHAKHSLYTIVLIQPTTPEAKASVSTIGVRQILACAVSECEEVLLGCGYK
ncbi:MAG: hypothetical protein GW919_00015 [Epsilonproteobacteria bacterium]|nr:hypothetical protein [Campylobacterota bacterium]